MRHWLYLITPMHCGVTADLKDSTCCHIWDDGFYKSVLHKDELFCATLQGCYGDGARLYGNFTFLVMLDAELKAASFSIS